MYGAQVLTFHFSANKAKMHRAIGELLSGIKTGANFGKKGKKPKF